VYRDERGASEVIGSILLVGIVVLAVTTFTAATLLDRAFDDRARADVTANVTTDRVVLNHTGGESVDAADVSVIVRGGGVERRKNLATTGTLSGDGDERFDPGEGWQWVTTDFDGVDRARVLVVHDNRTVLFEGERRVYPD
jgi:flagellin-like protein